MNETLPPGPRMPAILQTLGNWTRPTPFLERARRRYGSAFTMRLLGAPTFVVISDPEQIKEVFQAPPDVLHPGEGASILEPVVGPNSVILLDEAPASRAAQAAPARLPRRAHAAPRRPDGRAHRERGGVMAARGDDRAPSAPPAADARGDPARRLRARPRGAARPLARAAHGAADVRGQPPVAAAAAARGDLASDRRRSRVATRSARSSTPRSTR